ncbi:MAG: PQQ-binding-like beta-propeller repeat protein, partial [Limisphaerales bacterium]
MKNSVTCLALTVAFSLSASDWPQWRGVNRDGILHGEPALAKLPEKPAALWQIPIGKGQGGLSLAKGTLIVLHETSVDMQQWETAAAINSTTGKIIWQTPYGLSWQYTNVYGPGPRTAPLIDGDLLFCQSAAGVLACISMDGGKLLWKKNYGKDFGAKWFGGNAPGSNGTAASRHGNNGQPVTDAKYIYAPAGGHTGASLV